MSSPPHPLCHFGMAGWFHIRGTPTAYFKPKTSSSKAPDDEWPPRYWKFALRTEDGVQAAFVDFRRFARVRLLDCAADDVRNVSPLKENGPDPVVDRDVVTEDWLRELCVSRRAPIKALLLDQANISGIGNWVGDELLYDAKIHPEQYANTLSGAQIKQLHKSLHYVCGLSCEVLADSSKFPEEWLFKYRWEKGKKDATNRLPNGEKIVFLTVGGRTSAVVPTVQKKTGPVAGDVKGEDAKANKSSRKGKSSTKGNGKRKADEEQEDEGTEKEVEEEEPEEEQKPSRQGRRSNPRMPATEAPPKAKASAKITADGESPTEDEAKTAKRSITKRQAEANGPVQIRANTRRGRRAAATEPEEVFDEEDGDEQDEVVKDKKASNAKTQKGVSNKRRKVEGASGTEALAGANVEKGSAQAKTKGRAKKVEEAPPPAEVGRRRSGRLSGR
ncbi:MAG: hypothetical protein LQ340_005485 [Diploschistes diacapsis]|nr:MAG: hypothetical protein LQ340_005485 [Diploschistes diacapsis]